MARFDCVQRLFHAHKVDKHVCFIYRPLQPWMSTETMTTRRALETDFLWRPRQNENHGHRSSVKTKRARYVFCTDPYGQRRLIPTKCLRDPSQSSSRRYWMKYSEWHQSAVWLNRLNMPTALKIMNKLHMVKEKSYSPQLYQTLQIYDGSKMKVMTVSHVYTKAQNLTNSDLLTWVRVKWPFSRHILAHA